MLKITSVIPLSKENVLQQITRLNATIDKPRWKIIDSNTGNQYDPNTDNLRGPNHEDEQKKVSESAQKPSYHLEANYRLKDFPTTWQFLNTIAKLSNSCRHHPTIITTYNKVKINLTTHDIDNNISFKDLKLAQLIERNFMELQTAKSKTNKPLSLKSASKIINELVNVNQTNEKP